MSAEKTRRSPFPPARVELPPLVAGAPARKPRPEIRPLGEDVLALIAAALDGPAHRQPAFGIGAVVTTEPAPSDDPSIKGAQLTDPDLIREFVLGGKSKVTLRSMKTGKVFCYRVFKLDEAHFVKWRVQDGRYDGIGLIRERGPAMDLTKKSRAAGYSDRSEPVMAFRWMWEAVTAGQMPKRMEVWHAGECCSCGKALTTPESIRRGWGPDCWKRVAPSLRCDPAKNPQPQAA